MSGRDRLVIQEVGPRDGLQIERTFVPTHEKVRLVEALADCGFSRIEVSSFVSPKAVPALRDAAEVFAGICRRSGLVTVALVPNRKGAERAVAAGAGEINFVMSASETHNLANMGMGRDASLAGFGVIKDIARSAGVSVNAPVATAFGCPFEGERAADEVDWIVDRYLAHGVDGITLADTTGMANPRQVAARVSRTLRQVPADAPTLHFHDTRGLGIAKVLAAHEAGALRFDAALGGLGGCPFAPGASGNVCTEDLASMCHEMGIETGVDVDALLDLSRSLPSLVGHEGAGQVARSGRPGHLHPAPSPPH